ncbi:MAG: DNA repair protein RecN [Paludibacter sp.]|nr:DNA repair protein RecN [Paludibacter sp.]
MLKSLFISNYALISSLDIRFDRGFTVMTGETGAGKSIILGALSLILGQRADNKSIRSEAEKCIVEAEFTISGYKHLNPFFETYELDNDGVSCTIRREINVNGKSRAFINDTPVALAQLKELSGRLLDIHSQHENLLLSNASYQLEVVDTVVRNSDVLLTYQERFQEWRKAQQGYLHLKEEAAKATEEYDFLKFQYQQLEDARLTNGEQEELEAEENTLEHAGEIRSTLHQLVELLEGEGAVLPSLKEAQQLLGKSAGYLPQGQQQSERLQSAYIELKELKTELDTLQSRYDPDPQRLEQVQNRLSELYTLQHKFKLTTVEELLQRRDEYASQLEEIESFDERIADAEKELTASFERMKEQAEQLSESRRAGIEPIEQTMIEQLKQLGMPNIRFQAELSATSEYTLHGHDKVRFLFSANKNRDLQPVEQIASGGEISRLMLSIKAMIAEKSDLPTVIFDEIDTGISGEIAHRMGSIMQQMSRSMQVVVITHLPQIAAKGGAHFKVYKDDEGARTETYIRELNEEERLNEIASMISGTATSEAALQNARELLRN